MAQIKEIIDNASRKQKADVDKLKQRFCNRMTKLRFEIASRPKILEENPIHFLKIDKEKEKNLKNVSLSKYNDLIDMIATLAQKANGEPLNAEMAQIVNAVKESKREHERDISKIMIEYIKRAQSIY